MNRIIIWAAEKRDPRLQVKAISVTLKLLYGDVQFTSIYRPALIVLSKFKLSQLLNYSDSADYKDVVGNFISYLVRNNSELEFEDFKLTENDIKYMQRREFNSMW
jgi:hypothetical protein